MIKKKIILVVGSHKKEDGEAHQKKCQFVAEQLADRNVHLLTGGGPGVMAKVSRFFVRQPNPRGLCLGALPCASETQRDTPRRDYPNKLVEIPIQTHLPGKDPKSFDSRNHINALTASAVIGLPGGAGTLAEMELGVGYGKKCVAFLDDVSQIEGLSKSASFGKGIKIVDEKGLVAFLDKIAKKSKTAPRKAVMAAAHVQAASPRKQRGKK